MFRDIIILSFIIPFSTFVMFNCPLHPILHQIFSLVFSIDMYWTLFQPHSLIFISGFHIYPPITQDVVVSLSVGSVVCNNLSRKSGLVKTHSVINWTISSGCGNISCCPESFTVWPEVQTVSRFTALQHEKALRGCHVHCRSFMTLPPPWFVHYRCLEKSQWSPLSVFNDTLFIGIRPSSGKSTWRQNSAYLLY